MGSDAGMMMLATALFSALKGQHSHGLPGC